MIVETALKESILAMTNPTPESCSNAIALCIEALNHLASNFDEVRIDRIGQNGNSGEHYFE